MKLRKILLVSVLTTLTVVLSGCSEKLVDLTSSERDAVVSYSAHVVTKYNGNQKKGLVYLDKENLNKIKKNQKPSSIDTPVAPVTPAEPSGTNTNNTNNGTTDSNTKTVTAKEAIGITGLNVVVTGLELSDSFTGGNGAFNVTPVTGKKLLSLTIQLTNETTDVISLDMLNSTFDFAIKVNDKVESKSMVTILQNDFSTMQKQMAAGEKLDTMLFFSVSEKSKEELSKVDLVVSKDKTNYVVNVK